MKAALRAMLETAGAWAARPYITGPRLDDALAACESLHLQDYRSTISFWDGKEDSAEDIVSNYAATITAVGTKQFDCYVSVKPWSLKHSRIHFREFCRDARARSVKLHFDSASTDDQEHTFQLIRELVQVAGALGCTLPGRWHRSVADAEQAIELGLSVRVVKGQWADPSGDADPSTGFLRVIDRLAGRARYVSVATHDPALARAALAALTGTSTEHELELLYGLPMRAVIPIASAAGVPIRVYLPYGHAWLPYVLAKLREKPQVAWWLLRDLIGSARLKVVGWKGASRLPPTIRRASS